MVGIRKSVVIGLVGLACASVQAGAYEFEWTPGTPGSYGVNNNGGQLERITGRYDEGTDRLDWTVVFSNQVTEGFTLAISPGANPKNHPGQLALFYFDASNMADSKLTTYGYNGLNAATSWRDGDGTQGGNQTADLVMTDTDLRSSDAKISVDDNEDGTRTLGFSIDASSIIGHNPAYPSSSDEWTGASFGESIGIWMHTFRSFNAAYGEDGGLTSFSKSGEGWIDGANLRATAVPMPGPAAMTALGLVMVGNRRRRSETSVA